MLKAKLKNSYYWIIAAIGLLGMTVCGGIGNCLSSSFLIPVSEGLGIGRSDYSLAMSLRSMTAFGINIISGALLAKYGFRKIVSMCLLFGAVGLCIMGTSQGLLGLCIGAMIEASNNMLTATGHSRLIGSWFHRHHGLVMGIVTCATGLGGSLYSIVLSRIIEGSSWRHAYFMEAATVLAVALIIAVFVRNHPRDMGLRPYGEGYLPKKTKKNMGERWSGIPMEELKKKPVFYLMLFGTFLSSVCPYMAFYVISPFVQDCGMSARTGASVQSVVLFSLAAAKLLFGFLSDKFGVRRMMMVCLVISSVSLFMLAGITGPVSAHIAAAVFAISLVTSGIAPPLLVDNVFGYMSGPKALGVVVSMVSIAGMVSTPVSNLLRDAIGSYRPVFRGAAIVNIVAIVLYCVIFAMADKEKALREKTNSEEVSL